MPFFCTFLILIMLGSSYIVYSQEGECDAASQRRDWFYGQRKFPFDSIPSEAYANAIYQKNLLEQTYGYLLQAPARWTEIGPKPFQPHPNFGTLASGRISALVYDKRDQSGNTIYIAPAGGGVLKTTDGGYNWVDISGDLKTLVSGAIAIDYQTGAIYYGSGTNHYFGTE